MEHLLDNPAWHALRTENKHLGQIAGAAAYFQPDVSPFVALAEPKASHLAELYEILPFGGTVVLVSNVAFDNVAPWGDGTCVPGYQMLFKGAAPTNLAGAALLTSDNIPQMLSLTTLTSPGPFLSRTIEFGHYEGIFEGNQLVAMAGQRMHVPGFAEISAVCTHPGHLGKGHARLLVMRQVNRILEASEIPFLHVKSDNQRAIAVYESLGFEKRTDIFFHLLKKEA